jgi:hypothetical protein
MIPQLCRGLVLMLVAGSVIQPALGQDKSSQDKKDPQATYEPRSKPGAGQKLLEKFVGDWDVAKTFVPRSGAPSRQKGECRQTMIHGGRFLRSVFVFYQGDRKTTGEGLIGFDTATGTFTSVWTDSRATRMSLRRSKDKFNGSEIVLYSGSLDEAVKNERRSRTVTRLDDAGNKIIHRQYAISPNQPERLVMELVLTRKAAH